MKLLKGLLAWLPRKNAKPYFATRRNVELVYINTKTSRLVVSKAGLIARLENGILSYYECLGEL